MAAYIKCFIPWIMIWHIYFFTLSYMISWFVLMTMNKMYYKVCSLKVIVHVFIQLIKALNTLRPRQNGCHFPDDIFKWIFLNENVWILISLKFVPKGLINNIPALIQIMAWHHPDIKPLSEPMMVSLLMHVCVTWPRWVNSSPPSTAHICQWMGSALIQIMVFNLFSAKPLSKSVLDYCQLHH